jgi:manganese transport protein
VLLVLLANNGALMGDLRNRPWQNLGAAVGLLAILATCYRLVTLILAS